MGIFSLNPWPQLSDLCKHWEGLKWSTVIKVTESKNTQVCHLSTGVANGLAEGPAGSHVF
jgi:hypothetical protein